MRFLTVVHDNPNADHKVLWSQLTFEDTTGSKGAPNNHGVVTLLIQSLLARCVVEIDTEVRLVLASLLGEIGAIDPNRLGGQVDSSLSSALTTDSFESYGKHGLWRLGQPPWKSQIIRYELQLVTKHLVFSLKAAPTTLDQHKVAYTIQVQFTNLSPFPIVAPPHSHTIFSIPCLFPLRCRALIGDPSTAGPICNSLRKKFERRQECCC